MSQGGGQMQQGGAAATTVYENGGAAVPGGDSGDAVMTRWLQSAGLQHLASPLAPNPVDHHLLPNILMQGYGPQSADERQRLSKLMRNINLNGEIVSTPYIPSSSAIAPSNDFQSPEFRGDFGAGLLDLHSMDDTELLPDHIISEPIEASSSMPAVTETCEGDFDGIASWGQTGQADAEASAELSTNGKENSTRENNVAKIKVVVRKRPLNKKEMSRKEDDIVTVSDDANLTLHEPKVKVDLTAYVEKHEFCFDAVLDEHVTNDEVYRNTVEPIIPIIFQRTKATCFAYGQTGSGKTYTMKPLPIRAAEDLVRTLHQPVYRHQRFKLWLGYFEIYGGKLFDLLNDRKKLCMREDGKQQVCIVGLQEFEVSNVQIVKEYIERGNATRSTGSTGANEESSRSHAILQLVVKKHKEVKESKRNNDGNDSRTRNGKVVGKISFIDLAGSERGADTTDNDRQTRIEGAQINKSLLALKECIRALDNDQIHIPFRGSKLTEVLRDSFVGNSRTVMISCISPSAGSCEHTLNTLRYADRVKSLSKSGNPKKDQGNVKEPSTPTLSNSAETRDDNERSQESIAVDKSRRATDDERQPSSFSSNFNLNGREESGMNAVRTAFKESLSQKNNSTGNSQSSASAEEKVQKTSPPQQKGQDDERLEIMGTPRKDRDGLDMSSNSYKQENMNNVATSSDSKQYKPEPPPPDENTREIIEEEKALIAAHRKEIEDTMEIVREEMKLLAEVDQPGSHIDSYMTQLSFVLSRKAATLVGLQARLARFQHRLKEQEIISRRRVPR